MKIFVLLLLLSILPSKAMSEAIYLGNYTSAFDPAENGGYPLVGRGYVFASATYGYDYIGWKYELTDVFTWTDYVDGYSWDGGLGDFTVSLYLRDQLVGSSNIINNGQHFFRGGIFNTEPLDWSNIGPDHVQYTIYVTPFEGNGNPFTETPKLTYTGTNEIWVSNDNPLVNVPEPETFALFLLGAVGLCVRRQIKANATLPV